MNLFATSRDPAQAAAWLDDARVVNQTRETGLTKLWSNG